MPTVRKADPYIHLERDGAGRISRVLHRREGDVMPQIGESDMGLFALSAEACFHLLPQFASEVVTGAGTGERNFLPFIPWVAQRTAGDHVSERGSRRSDRGEHAGGTARGRGLSAREGTGRPMDVLSIVIPAYNEERFIGTLLERIRAVDLTPLGLTKEVIVVDDHSADRTSEIVGASPKRGCTGCR